MKVSPNKCQNCYQTKPQLKTDPIKGQVVIAQIKWFFLYDLFKASIFLKLGSIYSLKTRAITRP